MRILIRRTALINQHEHCKTTLFLSWTTPQQQKNIRSSFQQDQKSCTMETNSGSRMLAKCSTTEMQRIVGSDLTIPKEIWLDHSGATLIHLYSAQAMLFCVWYVYQRASMIQAPLAICTSSAFLSDTRE